MRQTLALLKGRTHHLSLSTSHELFGVLGFMQVYTLVTEEGKQTGPEIVYMLGFDAGHKRD